MPGLRSRLVRLIPLLVTVLYMARSVPISPMQHTTFSFLTARRPRGVIYFERSRNVPGPRRLPDGRDGAGLVFIDVDGETEGETRNGRVEGTRLAKRAQATCDTSVSEAAFLPTFSVTRDTAWRINCKLYTTIMISADGGVVRTWC